MTHHLDIFMSGEKFGIKRVNDLLASKEYLQVTNAMI